jgi:hypothetical protein
VSSPNTPDSPATHSSSEQNQPDYTKLVKFLCSPFLDSPDSLRLDCEQSPRTKRILIRLAIEGEDKGRVFGRGGRNLQAIRTVLRAVAELNGHIASLEVFGTSSGDDRPSQGSEESRNGGEPRRRRKPSRPNRKSLT